MARKVAALISKGLRKQTEIGPILFGRELKDHQEEVFCRMACDGLALGVAFNRAGFQSNDNEAPAKLFELPRIQARVVEILEARRTTGVVTLAQVTDMLQRVYAGAHSSGEYSAAHNAAFSLARIYGHVTDRATVEVIRRPSRDPDAPSEQALGDWVAGLPAVNGAASAINTDYVAQTGQISAHPRAPAPLLEIQPMDLATAHKDLAKPADNLASLANNPAAIADSEGELPSDINWLDGFPRGEGVGGRSENGAPSPAVTGTPPTGAQSELLATGVEKPPLDPVQVPAPRGVKPKRTPRTKRVPVKKRGKVKQKQRPVPVPSAKVLFG